MIVLVISLADLQVVVTVVALSTRNARRDCTSGSSSAGSDSRSA